MRIYLDNCCYNRPYDSQDSFKVSLETRAKLHIQKAVKENKFELVSSYMLEYENSENRDEMKLKRIKDFQDKYSSYYVPLERREIMQYSIAYKDATHAACAIYAKCDYLITTDIRFQKRYKGSEIMIVNPLEFNLMIEEDA